MAAPAFAQVGAPAARTGFSITPYIGVLVPTEDLFSYSNGTATRVTKISAAIQPGTNVGGVLGASAGIRIGRLLAINVGAEDYLYNASFDVNGAKTAERKQQDLRFTGGIRVPFIGF